MKVNAILIRLEYLFSLIVVLAYTWSKDLDHWPGLANREKDNYLGTNKHKGQEHAKRALDVNSADGHNVLPL